MIGLAIVLGEAGLSAALGFIGFISVDRTCSQDEVPGIVRRVETEHARARIAITV